MALGREQLDWDNSVWKTLDDAVHDEFHRTAVGLKFIPFPGQSDNAMTVPADVIDPATMTVNEADVAALVELGVDFGLTRQQTATEQQNGTGVTLGTRAANLLAQAEDLVIFVGDSAFKNPLFKRERVGHRSGKGGLGLLGSATEVVAVQPVGQNPKTYGENSFKAVAEAYGRLQRQGHNGPYAVALYSDIYADTFTPVANMSAVPADQIKQLASLGMFGSGALTPSTGVVVSVGGNSMDLVVGMEPTTEVLQQDGQGLYHFRVFERFVLRIKDKTAIVRLNFE
jgi:uncharacterized linocin/CFP29 family protein